MDPQNNQNAPQNPSQPRNDGQPQQPRQDRPNRGPRPAGQGQPNRNNQGSRNPNQPNANRNPNQPNAQGAPGQKPAGGKPKSGGGGGRRRRNGQQMPSHTDLLPALDAMPVNKSSFNGLGGSQQTKIKGHAQRGPANQVTNNAMLKVMPLGGLGEIGKNMMAVEYGNDIIILDMGFYFPEHDLQPGVDYIIPDTTYLEQNKHKVRAIIITHGHMDHIGAAGYMIPKFPVPIYGSRLSLGMVAKQIEEYKLQTPNYVVLDPDKHERVQIGVFNIELVRVTHTIADSTAVVVRTPVGTIIDTGDWRMDPSPLDGKMMDLPRLAEIGKEGVLLLMSDSTSCDRPGRGGSEKLVEPTIHDLFSRADGRIIISTFSSSITRVQLIIDATEQAGRKLALVGRSMLSTIELCVKMGYLRVPAGLLVKVQDINTMAASSVVVLCTGSQGEENAALVRMSTGDNQNVKIKAGDTVIFSSSVIPGNEVSVVRLIDNLMREGANVFARSTESLRGHGPVHVGGHAYRDDAADLINIIRPKYYMPIHGEFHHLVFNAEVAAENGVEKDNIFVMDNGDVLELTATSAKKGARIPAGMVMIDGSGVGDVEGVVLRDRIAIGNEGIVMIVATVSRKTGKLVSSPDIISRGFIYMKDNEDLINKIRAEVRKAFERRVTTENPTREDMTKFKLKLRDEIADLLYGATKRNPMVLPVVNEI